MKAKIPPLKIPAGYELAPEGYDLGPECRVCSHPYVEWRELRYSLGRVRPRDESYIPYGYYIRKIAKRRSAK